MLIQAVVCVWLIPGRDLPMFNMEEIILFLAPHLCLWWCPSFKLFLWAASG